MVDPGGDRGELPCMMKRRISGKKCDEHFVVVLEV
jgi:hypothetical protein